MFRKTMTLAITLLAGCQTMPLQPGFDEVRTQVDGRVGHRVVWRTGGEEDRQADEAVRKLLGGELTVAAAQQIALLNNRNLQATYEELGIAQASIVQAGLLKNPVFDLAVLFPSGGGSATLDIGVAQDFLDVFFIPLRTRIAESQFEVAKSDVTAAVLDLAHATRLAFLQVQADEQMLIEHRQNHEAASASYEFAQRMHKAGNMRNVDLASEQASLAQAKLDLATATASLAENREQLTRLMGLWGDDTQWRIAAKLPQVPDHFDDLTDLESKVIRSNLDLAALGHRVSALEEEAGFTRSTSLVQELEIGAAGERDEGHWEAGPTIAVPLPIFDQGQARLATANAQLRRSQQLLYAKAVEIRSAARAARLRLVAAQETAIYYRDEILPLRDKIVKETLLQYNAMQVSVFQLLSARSQGIDAHRRYIAAVHEYWRARAQLDLLLAGRVSDSEPMRRSSESTPTRESNGH